MITGKGSPGFHVQLDGRERNLGWASKLGGLWCSHLPAGLQEESSAGESCWGKNAIAKFGGFKWKKKDEKRKTRTKTAFLLINVIEPDCSSVVILGFAVKCSDQLSKLVFVECCTAKQHEAKWTKQNQGNQENAENYYAVALLIHYS